MPQPVGRRSFLTPRGTWTGACAARGTAPAEGAFGRGWRCVLRELVIGNVVVVGVQPPGALLRVLTPDLEFEFTCKTRGVWLVVDREVGWGYDRREVYIVLQVCKGAVLARIEFDK